MRFLPQANPLYQKLSTSKVVLPDILDKLGKGGFTGYLHQYVENTQGYCIYAKGKMLCAVASDGTKDKTGFEALVMMFDSCNKAVGEINVYRMTTDLSICAYALVAGKRLYNGEDVRQVDIKGVLSKIKTDEIHGVVRFYANERFAMMFYHAGLPIGFYHDKANSIETSPDEARRVAALPGAKLEVSTAPALEELLRNDLLQMVNLQKLWQASESRCSRQNAKTVAVKLNDPPSNVNIEPGKLEELVEDLKEVAMAYLSRPGSTLIDNALQNIGGSASLYNNDSVTTFLAEINTKGFSLDPNAKIEEMVDLMQSEIAGRLAV